MFARGGYDGSTILNTVEEWVEETLSLKTADNLVKTRIEFGPVSS